MNDEMQVASQQLTKCKEEVKPNTATQAEAATQLYTAQSSATTTTHTQAKQCTG